MVVRGHCWLVCVPLSKLAYRSTARMAPQQDDDGAGAPFWVQTYPDQHRHTAEASRSQRKAPSWPFGQHGIRIEGSCRAIDQYLPGFQSQRAATHLFPGDSRGTQTPDGSYRELRASRRSLRRASASDNPDRARKHGCNERPGGGIRTRLSLEVNGMLGYWWSEKRNGVQGM